MLISMVGSVSGQNKKTPPPRPSIPVEKRYQGGRIKTDITRTTLDTVVTTNRLGTTDTIIIRKTYHTPTADTTSTNTSTADTTSTNTPPISSLPITTKERITVDTIFLSSHNLNFKKTLDLSDKKIDKVKFSFTRDTLTSGRVALLSFIPGVGQIYNRQYWKVPVIYGAMGGLITAGVLSNNKYKNYRTEWRRTINLNLPQSQQDAAKIRMNNEGMVRTMYFGAAAATYLYQVADATFNYRGPVNHIRQATMLSVVFPGAGFIYTRTYWRLPIYYGTFITMITVVDFNSRYYNKYAKAYNAKTDGDPSTNVDSDMKYLSESALKSARNSYRRNRDLGYIALIGTYVLSIIDTNVIATLKNWDMSPDLSMTIEPTLINNSMNRASIVPTGVGMSMKLRF